MTNYNAARDYYFRVRAANEYGIAEPSMPAMMRKKEGILLEKYQSSPFFSRIARTQGAKYTYILLLLLLLLYY